VQVHKTSKCYHICSCLQKPHKPVNQFLFVNNFDAQSTALPFIIIAKNVNLTSFPKVIWEERVATPHGREWTRLLRVLLTAQCPLQTSPITLPRVCYIYTAVPHASHSLGLHYVVSFSPPKRKNMPLP